MCTRAWETGVAVLRGLGLFCLPGEERNAQIKHSEQDAWRKTGSGDEWGKERETVDHEEREGERWGDARS